ncbi:MAG: hypothetical protein WDA71_12395 [Actinomycetota bacterium]
MRIADAGWGARVLRFVCLLGTTGGVLLSGALAGPAGGMERAVSSGPPHQAQSLPALQEGCPTCHSNPAILRRGAELYVKPDALAGSAHAQLGCGACHLAFSPQGHPAPGGKEAEAARKSCQGCHQDPATEWRSSVHGAAADGPGCLACHGNHAVEPVRSGKGRLSLTATCAGCHRSAGRLYYNMTYHGKSLSLGRADSAGCPDCHRGHGVFASTDPRSALSSANRLDTCRRCHSGAPPRFAEFRAHPNPLRPDRPIVLFLANSAYLLLIPLVFLFSAVHSILYVTRGARSGLYGHKGGGGGRVARFNLFHRISHAVVILTFTTLVVTGMPLKYRGAGWAISAMRAIGGPAVAGLVHRVAGAALVAVFLAQIAAALALLFGHTGAEADEGGAFRRAWRRLRHPDSILPSGRDVADVRTMFRWFLGRGELPRFGRFSYWEKFEYWSMIVGTAIIGVTGLVMWFPEVVTRVLPGVSINLSLVVHSNEALLAFGVIFIVFHLFNAHLRPGIYPVDPSIFTGYVPRGEAEEQRPDWVARLDADQPRQISARPADPPGEGSVR